MSNTLFAAVVFVVMLVAGGGAYVAMNPDILKTFDFETATPAEKSAYLDGKAKGMTGSFKPNFVSQSNGYSVSSSGIVLKYNTGMGSLTCGKGVDCKVKQCKRFLSKGISKQNITLTLRYTDNAGRSVGSQTLKTNSCQSIIKRWNAGADQRKKKQKQKMKDACSDKNKGMKPLGCHI